MDRRVSCEDRVRPGISLFEGIRLGRVVFVVRPDGSHPTTRAFAPDIKAQNRVGAGDVGGAGRRPRRWPARFKVHVFRTTRTTEWPGDERGVPRILPGFDPRRARRSACDLRARRAQGRDRDDRRGGRLMSGSTFDRAITVESVLLGRQARRQAGRAD